MYGPPSVLPKAEVAAGSANLGPGRWDNLPHYVYDAAAERTQAWLNKENHLEFPA